MIELLYSIAIVVFLFTLISLSINTGLTYPANYPERYTGEIAEKIKIQEITLQDIPTFYHVQIEDKAGKLIATTMPDGYTDYIQQAKETGSFQTPGLFSSSQLVYFEGVSQNILLNYQIVNDFTSPMLRKNLPPAQNLFYGLAMLLWVTGFVLIIGYFARGLYKELSKVMETNEEIRKMNLEFQSPKSKIKEINQVLQSLDIMKNELAVSLQKQWAIQQGQEKTLQALTHDIRTPVTLINGNLELLEETALNEEQNDLLKSVDTGVQRLNQYIDELKNLSGLSKEENQQAITDSVLEAWIRLAKGLAATKEIQVLVMKQEESALLIQEREIVKAFQNVVQNAVDYSPEKSALAVSFEDFADKYTITVTNEGNGFEQEALQQATQRFYTSAIARGSGHYGLGLAIVAEIMEKNHGKVELFNEMDTNQVIGAKVCLVLEKN